MWPSSPRSAAEWKPRTDSMAANARAGSKFVGACCKKKSWPPMDRGSVRTSLRRGLPLNRASELSPRLTRKRNGPRANRGSAQGLRERIRKAICRHRRSSDGWVSCDTVGAQLENPIFRFNFDPTISGSFLVPRSSPSIDGSLLWHHNFVAEANLQIAPAARLNRV